MTVSIYDVTHMPSEFDDDLQMNELRKRDESDVGVFFLMDKNMLG